MKIREILNLMEEIEKKHHDKHHGKTYGAANASGDDELDAPPEPAPVKPSKTGGEAPKMGGSSGGSHHHKHHQHKDTRAQQLDREFANIDLDEPESGDKGGGDGGGNSEFKKMAGSLGDDLYVVSLYDWNKVVERDFMDGRFNPNSTIDNLLRKNDDAISNNYRHGAGMLDSNNKTISALILNDRNGKFFVYSASLTDSGFEPGGDVSGLINEDLIDEDQASSLRSIEQSGERYHNALQKVTWRAGREASSGRIYDVANTLIGDLKLPKMPEEIKYDRSKLSKPDSSELAAFLKKRAEEKAKMNDDSDRRSFDMADYE